MTKLLSKTTIWVFEDGQSVDTNTEYRLKDGTSGYVVDVKEDTGKCWFKADEKDAPIVFGKRSNIRSVKPEELLSPLEVEFDAVMES